MSKTPNWREIEADLRENGFLAESMQPMREHLRDRFKDSLDPAREMNRLAQKLYADQTGLLPGRHTLDPMALAIQLMARVLSAYQGAIILIELGMPVEANALTRHVFEAAFWMGYLHTRPAEAAIGLQHETIKGEIGLFNSLLAAADVLDPDTRDAAAQQLKGLVEQKETLKPAPTIKEISDAAGYGGYYAHFRHLSGGASHASLKSIFGFLSRDDSGGFKGHQIGPDEDGIPEALHFAVMGLTVAIDALAKVTAYSDEDGVKAIQDAYNRFASVDPYLHEGVEEKATE